MRLLLRPTLLLAIAGLVAGCAQDEVGQSRQPLLNDGGMDGGGFPDAMPVMDAMGSQDAAGPIDGGMDGGMDGGVDAGTCECPDNLIDKFAGGFNFSSSYKLPEPCPIFGGEFGASLALSVSGEQARPSCSVDSDGNATYDSSLSAKAALAGADHLCKVSHNFGINGSFGVATKECADCDESTLLYEPNGQQCNKYAGEVGVSIGKTWHLNINKYKRVTIPLVKKQIGFSAKCGVDANITVDAKVGGSGSLGAEDFDCGDCEGCVSGNGTLGITGSGKGACNMFLSGLSKRPIKFGCTDCLIAKVGASVSGEASTGECETNACFTVSGTLGAELPKVSKCLGFRWFHVTGQAGFQASIAPTYNSCGGGVKWNPKTETLLQVTSSWGKCDPDEEEDQ